MTRLRGWLRGLTAAAALMACLTGAGTAAADDMKACSAVGSPSVRLACFDAAAKGETEGDIAACAQVGSNAVRLACFNAATGGSPGSAPAATQSDAEMSRLEEQMRAREAAMKARIEELQRQAAEVERRAAEVERKAAAAPAVAVDPVDEFGGKYIDDDENVSEETIFGDREAENDDPLTAERYGKDQKEEKEEKRLKRIAVEITKIDEGPYGKIEVTLSNGQVWKQIDNGPARWKKNGANVAYIRRAFLGSFLMTINDEGAALRVRRVK